MAADEYSKNIMKGMRWIPILEKAMKIHGELERRNHDDVFYKNSLGDILYLGLGFLQMMIDDEPSEYFDKLVSEIREDYISSQEDNLRFMKVFGKYESEFENKLEESRMLKRRGNGKAVPSELTLKGELLQKYKEIDDLISQETFLRRMEQVLKYSQENPLDIADMIVKDVKKESEMEEYYD